MNEIRPANQAYDATLWVPMPFRFKKIQAPVEETLDVAYELFMDAFETKDFEKWVKRYPGFPKDADVLDFDCLDFDVAMVDPVDENGETGEDPSAEEMWFDAAGVKLLYGGPSSIVANTAVINMMAVVEFLMEGRVDLAEKAAAWWLYKHSLKSVFSEQVSTKIEDRVMEIIRKENV